jgi:hypothetical protein
VVQLPYKRKGNLDLIEGMKRFFSRKASRGLIAVISLFVTFVVLSLGNAPQAASIAQGYTTSDSDLVVGMGASLSQESSSGKTEVERSSQANKGKFVGIVTTKEASLVTLTTQVSNLFVATQGEATAYVTDVNGAISKGDYIVVSPLKGVLMKANSDESSVVGTALENFDVGGANSQEITKNDGSRQTIKVGLVKIDVNPRTLTSGKSSKNQTFLQQLGQSLAGKQINDWQVITALVIFLLLLVVEGSLMYGAIHSAIISVGRNPLSRSGVYKQLAQVLATAVAVLAIGIIVIFGVLKV